MSETLDLFGGPPEPHVWYFGYGSNMERATFLGRRRMRPRRVEPARLSGWALAFDLPVGPGERAVANLAPDAAAHTWGVAWEIPLRQSSHLDRTEGVPHGAYRRVSVELTTVDGELLDAFTYHSERGRPGRKPSPRYMGLLLNGAAEHGLPAEWVAHLERFELAADERRREPEGQGRLDL
ncbi:MAG: gamma-glutamylcyclotransferase [Myxococcota bacterium]|nr:gamma-glutamylcyclotransferase [Myxococcota bacterium]